MASELTGMDEEQSTVSNRTLTDLDDDVFMQPDEDDNNGDNVHVANDGTGYESDPIGMVYCNHLIMRKMISYVSNINDRHNLEASSGFLRDLSRKTPYLSCHSDNATLNLYFSTVEPVMTIAVAGNKFSVEALTSSSRCTGLEMLSGQPEKSIQKIQEIVKRFGHQICHLKIGGISDFERRIGYLPDHQLVLSADLCAAFDDLDHVESLILRNSCLMAPVIKFWRSEECKLTKRISSICFHGIWFDHANDVEDFVAILSYNIRHLRLSDCSGKTLMNIVRHVHSIGMKLESIYLPIDYRTFRNFSQARESLQALSGIVNSLHICMCFSHFICQSSFRTLLCIVSFISDFNKITILEVDLSSIWRNVNNCKQFLRGLPYMSQLRTLRIFGLPLKYYNVELWDWFLESISLLSQIVEFSVTNMLRFVRSDDLAMFFQSLPVNLSVLVMQRMHHLKDTHFTIIAKRCPRLCTIYFRGMRNIKSVGIMNALKEFRNLSRISISYSGPVSIEAYEILGNRELMPNIEVVVLGGHKKQPTNENLKALLHRLPQFRVVGRCNYWRGYEYHFWRSYRAYRELLDSASYADCPGCGKDVTLFEEEDS